MNIYIVLLLLISVAVFCESSKCKGRECAAKRNYLEFLNRYEKFKEIPKDANEPQRRLVKNVSIFFLKTFIANNKIILFLVFCN